ncbi:hypothetical protein [Limnohabitans sp. B9-3]|uniref:hypothetical protein n=1 Tax=Limnohabitans sp. B9-3 TaxID=1100707 RepID=UPI00117AFCE9|nr:hypothetical protein [Limnohabitans sp. B9-3]
MNKSKFSLLVLAFSALVLSGCQTTPDSSIGAVSGGRSAVANTISFIDFTGFDRDLNLALRQGQPLVTVVMYDKVSPNSTPDRLQKWLNAVESNGGRVEIEPPPNELVPRNPLALISLVGGLWNVIKATADLRDRELTQSVKGHDAVISLERNDAGHVVVGKIMFKKAKTAS